jgi:hypothetical protein
VATGIEVVHMIAKGQMKDNGARQTPAEQFYSFVSYAVLIVSNLSHPAIVIATKPIPSYRLRAAVALKAFRPDTPLANTERSGSPQQRFNAHRRCRPWSGSAQTVFWLPVAG